MTRAIALFVYPGFQLLDAAGPLSAFEAANGAVPGSYRLEAVSLAGGPVASSSGIQILTHAADSGDAIDTLLVAGGDGVDAASADAAALAFVGAACTAARRAASVCSGAWLLASAGLLDGRRATTHWRRSPAFARRFPQVSLDADRIYIRDGKFWTSAGITAGIDLSLALIADDLGDSVARQVARQLVVYYRRPGGQSQFSEIAGMQVAGGTFTDLLDYVRHNLQARLDVDELAARACMSPRHFARRFKAEMGVTPARAVERLRVEAAAAALESASASVQAVARSCGFGDAERLRRAFLRIHGVPPSARRRGRVEEDQTPASAPRKSPITEL
jgi:transcriptional regulator GlxA family with amidase domain